MWISFGTSYPPSPTLAIDPLHTIINKPQSSQYEVIASKFCKYYAQLYNLPQLALCTSPDSVFAMHSFVHDMALTTHSQQDSIDLDAPLN